MQEFFRALALGPQTLAWLGLQLLLMIIGAFVAGPGRWRRFASVPLMLACVLMPCVAPLPPFPRALLACMGLLALFKQLQLDFEPRWARYHPAWHALSPFDVSTARPAAPAFDARNFALVLLHAALLLLVLAGLLHLPAPGSAAREPVRLLLGALMVYTAMETATESLRFGHRLLGIEMQPVQRTPIAARSVGDFWSRRWNRPVSAWLGEYVFVPLAKRRRPALALLASFAVSGALHAWMYYAAMGVRAAIYAGAFFVLQAPIVMLETQLGISRWPALAARAWTLSLLLATSPLFVLPVLQALGL